MVIIKLRNVFNFKFILIKVKKKKRERENINLFLIIFKFNFNDVNLFVFKKLQIIFTPNNVLRFDARRKNVRRHSIVVKQWKRRNLTGSHLERQVQEPMTIKLWILSFEQGWLPSCFHLFLRTKQKIKPTRALRRVVRHSTCSWLR